MIAYYNPFGNKSVTINFQCDKCSLEVVSNEIGIPSLDFAAETYRDSYNGITEFVNCDNCFKKFEITVWSSSAGGYVEVDINNHQNNSFNVVEIEEERDLFENELKDLNDLDTKFMKYLKEVINLKY